MAPKRKDILGGGPSVMATVPKEQQLGKCTNCLDFKRLTDLASGVCIVKCTKRVLQDTNIENGDQMAQGEFTKEEAAETEKAVEEVMKGISKPKQREFLGHFNDILLFIAAAKKAAPSETKKPT